MPVAPHTSNRRAHSFAATLPSGVRLVRLENGLQLILRPDHSAPVVSAQAWCAAGSINEDRWLGAGLSHVLEHMLFKGTSTRPGGRIDQEVQAAGGYMNAYTSFDRTVYWIDVPSDGAHVAIDILCDIFQHATLPADELTKELDVIRREMEMGNDDPGRHSSRRLFEVAYTQSPYRYPIIGLPDIFNRLTRDEIAAYYHEKYAPNNCFLVIVGDFDPATVIEQVTAAYRGTGARPVPFPVIPAEPPQVGAREIVEEAPIALGHVHMAWHTPDIRHADTPALDVLSTLLGSGRSSRLYQSVREKANLAHSVNAWIYTPGMAGLFGISAVCERDRFAAARDAILAELDRMKTELVSPAELAKAVKQFTAATLSTRKTMEGQAQDLGSNWMVARDLNFSERYLASVRQLTPETLRQVANKYLIEAGRTVFALLPQGAAAAASVGVEKHQDQPIQKLTLSNGLTVLVKEDHRLPFVEFRAAFNGGLLAETADNSGITALLSRTLIKGTTTRNAREIASEIESIGGSLDAYGGNHSFGVTAEVMREDFESGLHLFADVILRPAFPAEPLEREREAQLAALRGQRDQLLQCAFKSLRRQLFGDQGYGLDSQGTEKTVNALTRQDLSEFHQRWMVPNNGIVAVFGNIHTEAVRGALEAALGSWKAGAPLQTSSVSETVIREPRHIEERDKEQAVLALGFPGTTFDSPDRCALELIQEACSDMGSRLFMRVRDELGLAYYVGASNFLGRTPGMFAFYCGTSPGELERVESELRTQAENLRRDGLTEEELRRAKAKILGQKKIARQDLGGFAMTVALDELYGLGYRYFEGDDARYEAVTVQKVREVADKYLRPENSVLSAIRGK
jgi:zinc protease